MELIWAVGTRSGSEFAIELTDAATPHFRTRLKINAARECRFSDQDSYRKCSIDDVLALLPTLDAIKLEEPSLDDWLNTILERYPTAKVIGTHRPLSQILRSHLALRESWGFSPEKVLDCYAGRLELYERLSGSGRLYLVDVTRPDLFDARAFCAFLGVRPSRRLRDFVDKWPVINDLDTLRSDEQYADTRAPAPDHVPSLPGTKALQARYDRLLDAPLAAPEPWWRRWLSR